VTPLVAAPGDTKPSDASVKKYFTSHSKIHISHP